MSATRLTFIAVGFLAAAALAVMAFFCLHAFVAPFVGQGAG